jgi:hypothetical protein
MSWLTKQGRDSFVVLGNNLQFKWLELQLSNTIEECPVCLEASEQLVILHCGHILCNDCVLGLINSKDKIGTLNNLILSRRQSGHVYYRCPSCRGEHAFKDYILFNHAKTIRKMQYK